MDISSIKIGVVGLGYVGLPLAIEFARKYPVVGYDINVSRIRQLIAGEDKTKEVTEESLASSKNLIFTSDVEGLHSCNFYIVTVPTPINGNKQPDLSPLLDASELLGTIIKKGDIVVYESTVYPGATEDDCIPVIEKISGLMLNKDFYVGYSPERINPGDKERGVKDIVKITSGSNPECAEYIDNVYRSVITAGTYKANSIKVAEAAKVIENTQRDVNIALINELSIIFNRLNIDTLDVLEAAGTKWNFLPFRPGLVGGHCIGVDPYYLTHKSKSVGYIPDLIDTSRRINDGMAEFVVSVLLKLMLKKRINVIDSKVLIMGFTFKENCPDVRNTKVIDIVNCLKGYGLTVDVFDPLCSKAEVYNEYGISLVEEVPLREYDSAVVAVSHQCFVEMGSNSIREYMKDNSVLFDLKNTFLKSEVDLRL